MKATIDIGLAQLLLPTETGKMRRIILRGLLGDEGYETLVRQLFEQA